MSTEKTRNYNHNKKAVHHHVTSSVLSFEPLGSGHFHKFEAHILQRPGLPKKAMHGALVEGTQPMRLLSQK